MRLTAEDARKLMPQQRLSEVIESVASSIRLSAKSNLYSVKFSNTTNYVDYVPWLNSLGPNGTPNTTVGILPELILELENANYKVGWFSEINEEGYPYAGMEISWAP